MPRTASIVPLLLLFLWLLQGCATDKPPSGGRADTTPFQLLHTTPTNGAVQVNGKQLELDFSHEVSSRSLLHALRTFPDVGRFELTVSGKRATLRLLDTLQANKTYQLLLNRSLSDYRGKTLHTPTSLAFSTGKRIDDGTIFGRVVEYNGTAASNALLLAFSAQEKTLASVMLLNQQPTQIAQCDALGNFSFNHLPQGDYYVIAINDRNHDLAWSPSTEEYATPTSLLIATNSTKQHIRLSQPLGNPKPLKAGAESSTRSNVATGSVSGTCTVQGNPAMVIVEAISPLASYYAIAVRKKAGSYAYQFNQLPVGQYTFAASIAAANNQQPNRWQWNGGSVTPFAPSDPFTFYPELITVREAWLTERIDINFPTISATK